jgi:hypothetical protein
MDVPTANTARNGRENQAKARILTLKKERRPDMRRALGDVPYNKVPRIRRRGRGFHNGRLCDFRASRDGFGDLHRTRLNQQGGAHLRCLAFRSLYSDESSLRPGSRMLTRADLLQSTGSCRTKARVSC